MSKIVIRPAIRENTPIIVGLSAPSKGGKTKSALVLAEGLAPVGTDIVMLNTEGPRGHQYADQHKYLAVDLRAPYSYERYREVIDAIAEHKPGCLIVDSVSHAHDGPGGMLEQHEDYLERRAGDDQAKRDKLNYAAWIKPKREENKFIYRLLELDCPIILCFRAKEKIQIVKGQSPVNLGWQPITSDRVAFETLFTLTLPQYSKGKPDRALSDMREPFDTIVSFDEQISRELGLKLREWSKGSATKQSDTGGDYITADQHIAIMDALNGIKDGENRLKKMAKVDRLTQIPRNAYQRALDWCEKARAE